MSRKSGSKSAKDSSRPAKRINGKPTQSKDITRILQEGTTVQSAFNRAVRQALLAHKRAGVPIAVGQNGKVVWIPPDEIEVG
jgi:hypothetical protein